MLKQEVINNFLRAHPEYKAVEVINDDYTFYFTDNPDEPFSPSEFVVGSPTRKIMENFMDEYETIKEVN